MFRFGKKAAMSVIPQSELRLQKPSPEEVNDEYDFCDEEEQIAAPTMEEVETASKELQDTLLSLKPSSSSYVEAHESVVKAPVVEEAHESVFEEYEPVLEAHESVVKAPVVEKAHESVFEEYEVEAHESVYEPVVEAHESVYEPVVEEASADEIKSMREAETDELKSMREAETEEATTVEAIAEEESPVISRPSAAEEVVQKAVVSQAPTAVVPQRTAVVAPSPAVVQCVELFQRNPEVQAAVMSLARDPAVWDAFIQNEKVQELLRGSTSSSSSRSQPIHDGSSLEFLEHQHANPFIVAANSLMDTLWDILDSFVDAVHSMFGFLDRTLFGGQQKEPLDRPLKACMVLTVLLFSLVLLKRARRT